MKLKSKNDYRHYDGDVLYFHMYDDEKKIICIVSREAIDDYYRLRGETVNYENLFDSIRTKCEAIADQKYNYGNFTPDGRILIGTHDLN